MRYLLLNKDVVWLEFRRQRNEYLEVTAQGVAHRVAAFWLYQFDRLSGTPEDSQAPGTHRPAAPSIRPARSWTAIWM